MATDEKNEEWPPCFTFTPEGIAAMFLLKVDAEAGRKEQEQLADLFRAYFRGGQEQTDAGNPKPSFDREP